MRIEIEIPKEFECDYNVDKFKDFFGRAIGSIDFMHGVCGRYEKETAQMLKKAFEESKVAYDVEAKVAELENASASVDGYCETEEMIPLAKAIEIVRGKE